jgi:hypothetical protein
MANSFGTDILIQALDPKKAAAFYVKQLGFEITGEEPHMIGIHGEHISAVMCIDYLNSTMMGVWSDGCGWARGPRSISQLCKRSATFGDSRKWSIRMPRLCSNACRQ